MKTVHVIFSIFLLCCLLGAGIPVCAQSQTKLTIDQCQRLARENYPLIRQFGLIEQSKDMTVSNLIKAYFPKLNVTAIGGIMDGMPAVSMPNTPAADPEKQQLIGMIQLEQVIWDGGAIKAQKKIANASAEIERENVEVALYAIREQINQLFFGMLLIDEQSKQLAVYRDNLQQNLKRAEVAYANGVAYQSDIDVLKVEILSSDQQLTELNANRTAYAEMLSLLIHQPVDAQTVFEKPATEVGLPAASIMRPELNVFEQQRNMYNAQNSAITAQLMPKFGLMGFGVFMEPGINLASSKLDHLLVAGVSLSWNIGALYTQSNDRKKIQNNLMQVDVQQETFLFNTKLKLKQNYNEIAKSQQLLTKDDDIIRLRQNIKTATETKYENGVCTMNDLLREINALHLANLNKAIHEVQYLIQVYNCMNTLGNDRNEKMKE